MKSRMRVMAVTMTAAMLTTCATSVSASELSGGEISDGVFSWLLLQAYNSAYTSNGGTEDLWTNGIDGEDTAQWILDTAVDAARVYIATEQEFENEGLTLRTEEIESATESKDYYWTELGYGEYYEAFGITEDDLLATLEHSTKVNILYNEMRSELIDAVEDSEVVDFINEKGSLVQYIAIPHSSNTAEDATEDETENETEQEASLDTDAVYEAYKERLENGESLETLIAEVSENEEQKNAGLGCSLDSGYTAALLFNDNTTLSTGFKEALAQAEEGEIVYYDDTATDYQIIFCKIAFTEDWEGLADYSDTIKASLAAQTFTNEVLGEWTETVELANTDAVPSAEEVQAMFE